MPDQISKPLLARAKAGESAAISVLYDTYQADVYRFLYYRVGEKRTAEDLTAEVFIKMIKALPNYRLQDNRPFRAWLMTITRNTAIDHHRRHKKEEHVALEESLTEAAESPETQVERSLTGSHLEKALLTLTLDQREAVILRILGEVPIAEVAQILNKSETAVKALQRRGLQSLRRTLANWNIHYD
jgi:RNA polymerase sigma-70 factor (ECF subfamily)